MSYRASERYLDPHPSTGKREWRYKGKFGFEAWCVRQYARETSQGGFYD
jgi:hypothetical protein